MPKLIKTKVERGIWFIESTGMYFVKYCKRNPNSRNMPISKEKTNIKTLTEARRVFHEFVDSVQARISLFNDPMWRDVIDEVIKTMHDEY